MMRKRTVSATSATRVAANPGTYNVSSPASSASARAMTFVSQ